MPAARTVNTRNGGTLFTSREFRYQPASDTYICPGAKSLRLKAVHHKDKYTVYEANGSDRHTNLGKLAPHDLRRTCAKLCRKAGGDLEQIQLLLGHASIQTTERYLGTEQALANAVNDAIGLDLLVRTSTVHRATLP